MKDLTHTSTGLLVTLREEWRGWRQMLRQGRDGRATFARLHWIGADDGLPGPTLNLRYSHRDGHTASRQSWSLGWDTRKSHRAIVLQRYGAGYDLTLHFDLDPDRNEHNDLVILVLKAARLGGEFIAEGACRRWFGGRVLLLDGGQVAHGFTRIEQGVRWSLLFQHGWSENGIRPQ